MKQATPRPVPSTMRRSATRRKRTYSSSRLYLRMPHSLRQPFLVRLDHTFEHGILEELKPFEGEIVVDKTSRGALNSSAFERLL